MSNVNQLTQNSDGSLTGRYKSLTINIPLELVPTGNNGNNPSHRIYSGGVEIGAAWEKNTRDGLVFYSMTMDDPSFPQQLNIAAFPSKEAGAAGVFDIRWNRPRQQEAA